SASSAAPMARAGAAADPPAGAGVGAANPSSSSCTDRRRSGSSTRAFSAKAALVRAEADAEGLDERRIRLVALRGESPLEVGEHAGPEPLVGLGPRHDLIDLEPGKRQLLRRLDPAAGCGREDRQELRD